MSKIRPDIAHEAAATGFPAETLEKARRLMGLLDALFSHPFLKPRLALKGGTALNMFFLDVPRLSVDLDLNYIGAADRQAMPAERPKLEQAIQAVCSRESMAIMRMPSEHAGGKWRLAYSSSTGDPGNLELDVNFMLRTPLWSPVMAPCHAEGPLRASGVQVLDPHELAAGKLAALVARSAGRDLFDAREILSRNDLSREKLRLGFVVYGGINRKDWRKVQLQDIQVDPVEIRQTLVPMLRANAAPTPEDIPTWAEILVAECRERMSVVLPLEQREIEFLDRLNDHGDIAPGLITGEERLQAIIRAHPGLRWKAINVRKHLGLAIEDDETPWL